jgi:hypothetical protein
MLKLLISLSLTSKDNGSNMLKTLSMYQIDLRLLSLLKDGAAAENFIVTDFIKGDMPDDPYPAMLQALWQICLCFGEQKDEYFYFRYQYQEFDFTIEILYVKNPLNAHAFIIKKTGTDTESNLERFSWFGLGATALLMWHEDIYPEDIEKSIIEIDAVALQNGQIIKGQRITEHGISCKRAVSLCVKYN